MEPAAATAEGIQLLDLPDDLLGQVLLLVGREERSSVTPVCRRFWRLFYSQPTWWRSLRRGGLDGDGYLLAPTAESDEAVMQQLKPLRCVAGLLQHLSIRCKADEVTGAALCSLQPPSLPSLHLTVACERPKPDRGVVDWDYIFNRHVPIDMPATFAALAGLTALTRLQVHCDLQPRELPDALRSLSQLSSLLFRPGHNGSVNDKLGAALPDLAPCLTHLGLTSREMPPDVAAAIGALAQLRRLRLRTSILPPALAHAVAQLAALEALWLEFDGNSPGLEAAAEVWVPALNAGQLPQLSSLQLSAKDALPNELVVALAQQTQLTALVVQAVLGDVRLLSALPQLRRLSLSHEEGNLGQGPQLPLPRDFRVLEAYDIGLPFHMDAPLVALGGVELHSCSYTLGRWGRRVYEFSNFGQRLDECPASWDEVSDGSAEAQLTVRGASHPLPHLDQLLALLLPPGAPLHQLALNDTDPEPAVVLGSSRIAALHLLKIDGNPGLLGALPGMLPHLTRLELSGWDPAAGLQPDQLPSMPALQELALSRCIDSTGGSAIDACMPALLSQAPQLTSLSVRGRLSDEAQEVLEEPPPPPAWLTGLHGIQSLFLDRNWMSHLPDALHLESLDYLSLDDNCIAHLPEGQYLTGLENLSLDNNAFEQLPRCLAAATRMRSLSLRRNSLTVSAEDVEHVLARMPGLQYLHLDSCPPAVRELLLQKLPQLQTPGLNTAGRRRYIL